MISSGKTSFGREQEIDKAQKLLEDSLCFPLNKNQFRSLIWRVLLSRTIRTVEELLKSIKKSREVYSAVKALRVNPSHPKSNGKSDAASDNPLSQSEGSCWHNYFRNKDLLATITQDVVRTFPDYAFFRDQHVQDSLVNILFCYSMENPEIGYKQGMHELLAPLLFVTHFDTEKLRGSHAECSTCLRSIMSTEYLEHDAYALFCLLMEGVKCWYYGKEEVSNGHIDINPKLFARSQDLAGTNELLKKLSELSDERLRSIDLELYLHLERHEIAPQIYGIRWLRLLFGREFPFEDVLVLWDAIFANTVYIQESDQYLMKFPFVDSVFLSMLLVLRTRLLTSDYTECLQLLMRFPPMMDIQYIIKMAAYLQSPKTSFKPEMPLYMLQQSPVDPRNELKSSLSLTQPFRPLDTTKLKSLLPSSEMRKSVLIQSSSVRTKRKSISGIVEIGKEPQLHLAKESVSLGRELRLVDKLQPLVVRQKEERQADSGEKCGSPFADELRLSATSLQSCVAQMTDALRRLQDALQPIDIPLEHDAFVAVAELKQVRDRLQISLTSLDLPESDSTESTHLRRKEHYLPPSRIDHDASIGLEALTLEEAVEVTDYSEFTKEVLNIPFSTGTHI